MSRIGKRTIGWLSVIQLVLSLVMLDSLFLSHIWPGNIILPWLSTNAGFWFVAGTFIFTGVLALVCGFIILFLPTTTKTLTLSREGSYRLTISKAGVEHSLDGMVSREYPQLANAESRVHINRRTNKAKALVEATVVEPNDVKELERQVSQDAERNLTSILGIDVAHITVRLNPYQPGESIEVI